MNTLLPLIVICTLVITGNSQASLAAPVSYDINLVTYSKRTKTVTVNASIRNLSNEVQVINPRGLTFRIVYVKQPVALKNGGTINGQAFTSNSETMDFTIKPVYIELNPNDRFTKVLRLKVNDNCFERGRKYKLQLAYGQVEDEQFRSLDVWKGVIFSNEVAFQFT